jgi:hypothetical protein
MEKKILTIISLAGCLYITSCTSNITALHSKDEEKGAAENSGKSAPKSEPIVNINTSIIEPQEIPEHFLCPITYEVLIDPVIASDGHTYERKAIEGWFTKNDTSPNTGLALANKDLLPNYVVKGMLDAFKKEQDKSFLAAKKVQEINHKVLHESIKCFKNFEDLAEEQKTALITKLENAGNIWNKQTDENRYSMLKGNELLNISYEFLKIEFKQYLSDKTQTARHALAVKGKHVSTEKFWYDNQELQTEWIKRAKNYS